MSSLQFNSLLLEISNQLNQEQLDSMKFLCKDFGKGVLEKIKNGTQLFQLLTEKDMLAADKTEYLSQLLKCIKRNDLSDKLNSWTESRSGDSEDQPDAAERAKLNVATDVIAENLGKNWRKLGRKLGLTDVKLESVSRRHTDLEETARELLKEWRRSRRAEARVSDLVAALRACQLNLTAEKVEDSLLTP
ncbi:FAS-associated death domain protein [Anarrhichthys ocellatus]|uniref:FAS-associated death domain protein n=1 Tax=Anarrhichthys ocellatus TaxID=433405 RepID=UPI0012EEE0FC|nr:FAS-associated death domain protein [Anarrhichthys ocellatus]